MRPLRALVACLLFWASPALAADKQPKAAYPETEVPDKPADDVPECTDKPEVCGKNAFEAGVRAYRDNDFQTAIRQFRAALSFKWHPSIALNLGLAESKAGQFVAAVREFDAVLASSPLSPKLRDEATKAREAAAGELASIDLDSGDGAKPVMRVDGTVSEATGPVQVDPGPHRVEIDLGGSTLRRDVTLAPREHLRLSIDRSREVVVVPDREPKPIPAAARAPAPTPAPVASSRHGVDPTWFFVGAGATVVAGAVATWSALDTKSAFDSYESDLPRLGQAEANQRVEDGHGLETRTNVLWAVTGVLALGTTALGVFFVDWGPSKETVIAVGPGTAVLRGRF